MDAAPDDSKNLELDEFAQTFAQEHPELFGSAQDVLALFEEADAEFMNATDPPRRLSPACALNNEIYECWAVNHQIAWNRILTRRGMQLVELEALRLHFRTLDVDPNDFAEEDDIKFLCLCLWLLRNHRCITSVSLSVPVVAPRHAFVFTSMLRLTKYVVKLEIHGESPLESAPAEGSPPPELPTATRRDPQWRAVLDSVPNLKKLVLSSLNFSVNEDACALRTCVEGSVSLDALVLIDVDMDVQNFLFLLNVLETKPLRDFRLTTSRMKPAEKVVTGLPVIGLSRTLSRLYVHTFHGLTEMLKGLQSNETLTELTLGSAIEKLDEMAALREYVCSHSRLMRLKVCIRIFGLDRLMMHHLETMIETSSVRTLVLSGSNIGGTPSAWIAQSLAGSQIKELHLDGCKIECRWVKNFVKEIAKLKDFKELNLGTPVGDDDVQRFMFSHIVNGRACGKITLVCTDPLLRDYKLWKDVDGSNHFKKLSLCYSEKIMIDPVLHSLVQSQKMESFSISTTQVLDNLAPAFLAQIIRNGVELKALRLRCSLTENGCLQVLRALATSHTVVLLTVEHWALTTKVAEAFARMLRENCSLYRLEFYMKDMAEFHNFSSFLTSGISSSRTVAVVKMYVGRQYDIVPLDESLLLALQRNEMILSWATRFLFSDKLAEEATVLADTLDVCDAPDDMYERTGDLSPSTTKSRVQSARMATWSTYHALREAYPKTIGRFRTVQGQRRLYNLIRAVENSVKDRLKNEGLARET